MTSKVLITYASKHGSTAEIAERIGQVIIRSGLHADILPIEEVEAINRYEAVVIGSAVYAGQWRREVITFLEAYEIALTDAPVWIFSSGPTGEGDPDMLLNGWRYPQSQEFLINSIGPRDVVVFNGVLDPNTLNIAEKLIVKGVKAPLGDFRNWAAINEWAEEIAAEVQRISSPA